jgi:HAE1 family hydrophobic/amphiphilic exporter-1
MRATIIPRRDGADRADRHACRILLAGFSLNILTCSPSCSPPGLVVDDAIVVLENIEEDARPRHGSARRAVLGAKQVFFAVVATTATLAAVFVPISFLPGTAGRLFSEFGFVMAFAVALSALVALTLCPMLASRMLKDPDPAVPERRNFLLRGLERIGAGGERLYHRMLDGALAAPLVVLAAACLFAAAAAFTYTTLPEQLTPNEDRGFIPVSIRGPQGVGIEYMDAQIRQVEAAALPLLESGEVTNILLLAGMMSANSGFVVLTLAPWEERARTQQEIAQELNGKLQKIPGVQISARQANSLGIRGGGQGLQFAITGTDYDALADQAEALRTALEAAPGFDTVQLNYDTTQPELAVTINREAAADLGVPVETLGATLATLLDGREMGEYYVGGDAIPVRAQAPDGMIDDPGDLDGIYVRTADGRMVPLAAFVTVEERAVAPELPREGQQRAVPLTATLAAGNDLRQAMTGLEALAATVLPPTTGIEYLGEAATLNETSSGVAATFGFALLVVLLVLAAQFESFLSAVIIMITVPFGLAAAVFAIALSGGSLNIYSQIGLVMLVGIMAKNGILIVEFANQLREQGFRVRDAIREACRVRLRPVVMTMVATIVGGVPLVISSGAGSEARQALGWIVVGGLGMATVVTLFVTPVAFLLLAGFGKTRSADAELLEAELANSAGTELETTPRRGVPYPVAAE